MTTYIFQEVSVYGEKTAKCPKCGKYYKRKEKFWATINPWNVNKDGVMKSWDEVYQDVMNERAKWLEEPIEPHNCKEKLPPEESNPLTVDDVNNFVSYYREKESEIIRLASQIRNIEQEIKTKASEILSGKTFDYMEYKRKDSNYLYEPRESKIGEGYKYGNFNDNNLLEFYHKGRNKSDKQFNYDYGHEFGATVNFEDILLNQIGYYEEKLNIDVDSYNPTPELFNYLINKEDKSDDEIKCLGFIIAYLKYNESKIKADTIRWKEEYDCLNILYNGEK